MSKVIGIDLGTTNSVVAVLEGGKPAIIPNAEGSRLTPSVVGFTKNNERLVGQVAKRQAITNPENTIYSVKRFMGRRWIDVQNEAHKFAYRVQEGKEGMIELDIMGKRYTPQEISAVILAKLKQDAESYLGEKVTKAVITVPAYFNDAQRQATKDAGLIAGLDVLRIINEPTASALAYGADKDHSHTILVFDLGGGTFDISILELGDEVFEVKATSGNNYLGGDDFDQRIIEHLIASFKNEHGADLGKDRMALQRLKEASEKAKIELSNLFTTNVNLPFITADVTGPKHLEATITRAKFEEMTSDLIEGTMGPTRQAIEDAGLIPGDIDKVILVGGSTRMPAVQDGIRKYLAKEPDKSVNPDEAVALGAAIQAGVLGGEVKDVLLLDVTPLSLGIETLGGIFDRIIERNTTIPTTKSQLFSTATDGQTSVELAVLQGERELAADNKILGRFTLSGIPAAPRGIPQIEVTFDIDADGIVHVLAKDKGSGNEQKIAINNAGGLTREEIEYMRQEAEEHSAEDVRRRDLVELKNQADTAIYTTEKTIRDLSDRIPLDQRLEVEQIVSSLQRALDIDDRDRIQAEMEKLSHLMYSVSSSIYNQQPGMGSPTSLSSNPLPTKESEEPVSDADYEEVT